MVKGFLTYPELRTRGIRYSREHIRRKERDGSFPLHTDLTEDGRRIGWQTELIDAYEAEKQRIADGNAKIAKAETKRRAKAAQQGKERA